MRLHRKTRQYLLYELTGPDEQTEPLHFSMREGDGLKGAISLWPADFAPMRDRSGAPVQPSPGFSGLEPVEQLDGRSGSFQLLFRNQGERTWRTLDVLSLDGSTWCSAPNINLQFNRTQVEVAVRCTQASGSWAVEVSGR